MKRDGESMEVSGKKEDRIISLSDLLEKMDVNLDDRDVERHIVNKRDNVMKDSNGNPLITELYQVKAWLTKKYSIEEDVAARAVTDLIKVGHKKRRDTKKLNDDGQILATVALFDAHIDKLDIKGTTIKNKCQKILNSTNRLLDNLMMYNPSKFLFINGGDYFNTDHTQTTTRGTLQMNNTSEYNAWRTGIDLQAQLLENIAKYKPVEALFLPGNHDEEKLKYLKDIMMYYFKDHPNITISDSVNDRQYRDRGKTLLGFTHGANTKPKDLPGLMFHESKKKYQNYEFYRGHRHTFIINSFQGVLVHTLTQPGIPNDRAEKKGFDVNQQQTHGMIHHKKKGKIAHVTEPV